MFFRAVVVTLLLGATVIVQLRDSPFFRYVSPVYFYALIGFTYTLTLVYALLLRRIQNLKPFAYIQILGDVFFITLLIYFTGGISSIFSWVYLLAIFSAGTILYRRGGILVASASSILYGSLLDLEYYQFLLPIGGRQFSSLEPQGIYVLYLISVNMVAFYLVAILSSYLAEQVRRKEEELKKRIIDYRQLERLYKHIVQNGEQASRSMNRGGSPPSTTWPRDHRRKLRSLPGEIDSLPRLSAWASRREERGRMEPVSSRWETRFPRKDGTSLILGFSISPLKDSSDREMGNIFIFQDLTRLREMEEHLKRADRLAAVGKMAAGIAHEIRNPLASISGSIEILKDDPGSSPQSQQLMGIVLREVNRLNTLIADFLLFARPFSPGKEKIHLNHLIEEILQMFPHDPDFNRRIRLETQFQDDLHIQGDPHQIRQVFWNLFINAAQALPEGGTLRVELRKNSSPPAISTGRVHGEISVIDSGTGIGAEDLEKIFDPFFTTKERGTGLGLSIVHSLVEGYGGKVTVQSQPGKGTTFSVFLPLQP
jgi:two-component system sensor histidine kinase PilS (NtrC family)